MTTSPTPRPPRSRTVLFGALAVAPPVGVLLSVLAAALVRGPGPLAVTGGLLLASVPGFFYGVEAIFRARKELRHPVEVRPRLAELGLGLGLAGVILSLLFGTVTVLALVSLT